MIQPKFNIFYNTNQNTDNKPNLILVITSVLVILAIGLGVGFVIALNNKPTKQMVNQNTSVSSIDNNSSISNNSSFNTQNSLSSSITSTTLSVSSSSSLGLSSSNNNSNIAQITSPYLPNFKVNYDQNVWTQSGGITFVPNKDDPTTIVFDSQPIILKSSIFELKINITFLSDGPNDFFVTKNKIIS